MELEDLAATAKKNPYPPEVDFAPKVTPSETRVFASEDKRIGLSDLSPDQKEVLFAVSQHTSNMFGSSVVSLGGYAGTGKSTLIPLLSEELGNIHRTAFCSFTGKASNVMKRKLAAAGIKEVDTGYIGTIHGLMYYPEIDSRGIVVRWVKQGRLLTRNEMPVDLIIVDEASMVGNNLLSDLRSYGIPIVLVGDHGQLEPVLDKSVMAAPDFRLEKIHRQAAENPIIQLSQQIREKGDIPRNLKESENIRFVTKQELGTIATEGFNRLGMGMGLLVRSNKKRVSFNKVAARGDVPRVGDILICLKNNPPIFNGMRGILSEIEVVFSHWFRVVIDFPDDGFSLNTLISRHQFNREKTIESIYDMYSEFKYPRACKDKGLLFDFGMALTVHKAQGSSFEEAILIPERWGFDDDDGGEGYKRWLYTGVTRASEKLYILR